jgi:hypothetical protein
MARVIHPRQQTKIDGVHDDLIYRRPNAPSTGREDVANSVIIGAFHWDDKKAPLRRAGRRRLTDTDVANRREGHARCVRFADIQHWHGREVPAWYEMLGIDAGHEGKKDFLCVLLKVFRMGSIALEVSYEEAMAVFRCSRRTWRNWTKQLEAAGYIRCCQTWAIDEEGRERFSRMLYRIGPEYERRVGLALFEHVGSDAFATMAKRNAASLRRSARQIRYDIVTRAWAQHHPEECRERGPDDKSVPSAEIIPIDRTPSSETTSADVRQSTSCKSTESDAVSHGTASAETGSLPAASHSRPLTGPVARGPQGGPPIQRPRSARPASATQTRPHRPKETPSPTKDNEINSSTSSSTQPSPPPEDTKASEQVVTLEAMQEAIAKLQTMQQQDRARATARAQSISRARPSTKITCPDCNGSGGAIEECPTCESSGEVDIPTNAPDEES